MRIRDPYLCVQEDLADLHEDAILSRSPPSAMPGPPDAWLTDLYAALLKAAVLAKAEILRRGASAEVEN